MAETVLGFRIEVKGTDKQTAEMARLNTETNKMRQAVNELNKQERKGNNLTQKQIVERQKLKGAIAQNTQAYRKLAMQTGQVSSFTQKMGKSMAGAAMRMGAMYLGGRAIFGVIGSAVKIFKDFEKANSKLEAVLGATGDEMDALKTNAKELGATTQFTATQVVSLQTEFAKLGFPTSDILDMTEATLNGASALGSDLAEQAALTGSTLKQFGLAATDATEVNDIMATAASKSALDFSKLSTALPIVGATANAVGRDLTDVTTLLGGLADRGLDASTSGTSLRNVFLELSKQGLTMDEAMAKINGSTDKAKTSMELFGKRGATTGLILAEMEGQTSELGTALEDTNGAAKEMAETMLNNLSGDVTKAQSAWEGFVLSLEDGEGKISKALRKITQVVTDGLQGLTHLNKTLEQIKTEKAVHQFNAFKKTGTEAANSVKEDFEKVGLSGEALQGALKRATDRARENFKAAKERKDLDMAASYGNEIIQLEKLTGVRKKSTAEMTDAEIEEIKKQEEKAAADKAASDKAIKEAERVSSEKQKIEEKRIEDEKKLRAKGIEDAAAFKKAKEAELFESERMQKINNIETEFNDRILAITGNSERETLLKLQLEELKRQAVKTQEEEWKIEDEEKALEERQLKLENELLLAGEDLQEKIRIFEAQKQAELSVKDLTEQQKRAIEINYEKQKDEARKAEKDRFIAKTQFEMGLAADAADSLSTLAKKGSEEQKALAVVSATIHGAQAVMGVLSAQYTGIGWIDVVLKAIAIAGVVAKTRQQIQTINSAKHEDGGLVAGASHAQGGVQMYHKSGEHLGEMEGNEYIISAKRTREIGVDRLDAMNFGGETAPANGFFQKGGAVPNVTSSRLSQATLDRQQNMEDLAATVSTQMQEAIVRTPVINNASETAQVAAEVTNSENSLRFG